ncbi:MAG: hypothetical protein AAF531_27855 [Actinomycetota bacterium]
MTDVVTSEVSGDAKNTVEQAETGDELTVTERALQRISVTAPYFALENLTELGHGIVSATVPATPPTNPETGVMEAAQVARHLAILGSCAAALDRDDNKRHHYLATKAHYSRLSTSGSEPSAPGEPLEAEALASWVDRRTARSLVKLSTRSGHGLYVLDVEYTVLAPKMFSRLHPPQPSAVEGEDGEATDVPTELGFDVTPTPLGVDVDCGPIPPSMCAGHFPDYPAAPVAIVMGQLCRGAGLGLASYLGIPDLRYRIEAGHVLATRLAAAGQRLALRTRYQEPVAGGHRITGVAEADGETIGEVDVIMSTTTPRPEPVEGYEGMPC